MSDQQARRVQELLRAAGVPVAYRSFPDVGHSMHGDAPDLYEACGGENIAQDARERAAETVAQRAGQPRERGVPPDRRPSAGSRRRRGGTQGR
jgi:acetyl esterase/lipase